MSIHGNKGLIYAWRWGPNPKFLRNNIDGLRRFTHELWASKYDSLDYLINWGASKEPRPVFLRLCDIKCHVEVFNYFDNVKATQNKLNFLAECHEIGIPAVEYTSEFDTAIGWVEQGHPVFARTLLRSHSGNGIVVCNPGTDGGNKASTWREGELDRDSREQLPNCVLYTKGIRSRHEYRVHVCGKLIDVQKKRIPYNTVPTSRLIKNHANGWIYAREKLNSTAYNIVVSLAKDVMNAFDLAFGAVDIIYDRHADVYRVLEVNTAPNLEGTTREFYLNGFKELINEL